MPNGSRTRTAGSGDPNDAAADSFYQFFEGWLVRQEHFLDELISVEQHCHESREEDLKDLINRVLFHYEQYYEEKSRIAQRNIFLVFSPYWFTPLESSFLWIAGFKPALAFRVINESVNDLSGEQSQRISRLIEETKVSERMMNDELARIHESIASPPLLDLARRKGRMDDVNEAGDQSAIETLGSTLESLVARADLLRTDTVSKLVEILNPVQNVKFLTAVTQLYLRIRNLGQRHGQSRRSK
ncbi:protein RESPONSE TO ABA AND SALT 1 [Manihot esculenta]|uniref:DOG1 domain-containing protein n=1 Tax=Manihot esculenta TaxID=3983 RepID=A0A2C9VGQ8_MANES|nr:protein RESPONSE TO ABA AND SALT 1 [Manihot esculenta]OAY43731.1 hypothetical protein MANES_08G093300v8 [Manihot esculenta]